MDGSLVRWGKRRASINGMGCSWSSCGNFRFPISWFSSLLLTLHPEKRWQTAKGHVTEKFREGRHVKMCFKVSQLQLWVLSKQVLHPVPILGHVKSGADALHGSPARLLLRNNGQRILSLGKLKHTHSMGVLDILEAFSITSKTQLWK